ncbi:hypothetical protein HUE46_06260 [Flavobacterium columnare]|uniref:hypothetical protein n=1 Tax=Flavobacterium columnare TaxID=996 RepID=UPI00177E01E1|nr:hypothetical protein [Flavobacterium columnare]QOG89647.1 hypothetical protein HUE41_06260 [Flavobacterium columnare]QOG92303.1 hypothetical protein HUE42_06255 [Flavobacterium columnare]QOG94968.1 hypothetical protein HUE43_06260 [Flavobacterium columnare]QOG97628.1 hypothetical protein HUE44_06255 [Flavobacterium columnare]QOH00287.1 hypothetical protein HUE45_06255 [Flavobacterium columnare]
MEREKKILKFHFEEIIFILLILSTDLKDYEKSDLKLFAEAIQRIDSLFTENFLEQLKTIGLEFDNNDLKKFIELKEKIQQIYSYHWYEKLLIDSQQMLEIKEISKFLLEKTNVKYVEPIVYSESHMNIDW